MCFNKCGLIARVEDGVVKKLDPNPNSLKSRGMLCARGNAGIKQLYDPDRLKYPLLRKGERGEGRWQRLSWDEALDLAAEKLERIGREYTRCGFLFMAGTDMQSTFVHRFAEVYGSYNIISHESNCLLSRNRAFLDTYGVVPMAGCAQQQVCDHARRQPLRSLGDARQHRPDDGHAGRLQTGGARSALYQNRGPGP